VGSRTLELLDRGGGSSPFVNAGFKVDAVNIISHEKLIGRVCMKGVHSPYPYGLMLPQSETERLLVRRYDLADYQNLRQFHGPGFDELLEKIRRFEHRFGMWG
jgi:hypothetical protein